MSMWIAGTNLRRQSFHQKMRFSMKGISDNDYENAQLVWSTTEKKP